MPVITYGNTINWNMPLTQRPHHIFSELSKRGWTVHWVDINKEKDTPYCRKINENLFIYNDWNKYVGENKDKVDIYFSSWSHRWVDAIQVNPKIIVYDSLDLFEANQSEERNMINKADIIFATTKSILEFHKKHTNKDIVLCENGCFNNLRSSLSSIPDDLSRIPKPWILFSGALALDTHSSGWISYELIKKIPKKGSLIVVGIPWGVSSEQMTEMKNLNIYFLNPKLYKDLQRYYYHCDVSIVPFKRGQIADNSSPLKLIEAANQGTITVSSNIPNAVDFNKKYPEAVLVSNNDNQFLKNIERAISSKNNKSVKEQCYTLANEQDWSKKVDIIENSILQYAKDNNISI